MDYSAIYSIYSEAMSGGKLEALKMFLSTLIKNPVLAVFYTYLIFRNLKKAVAAFIKLFI